MKEHLILVVRTHKTKLSTTTGLLRGSPKRVPPYPNNLTTVQFKPSLT